MKRIFFWFSTVVLITAVGILTVCLTCSQPRAARPDKVMDLIRAIEQGDKSRVAELAHLHWVPVFEDKEGLHIGTGIIYPLHVAAYKGRAEIMQILLNHESIDVDIRDSSGLTPVMWVVFGSKKENEDPWIECLDLLAKYGADLNARSGVSRFTALHDAACYGRLKCARRLIQLGADVNVTNSSKNTPLHEACQMLEPPHSPKRLEMVKLLVEAGSDVFAKNKFGQTPEDIAREQKHLEVADYLKAETNKRKR